jgi:hypothetical protein
MPRRKRFAMRPTLDIMETRLSPSRAGSLANTAMMIGDQSVAHARRSQLIVGVDTDTRHAVHSKDSTSLLTSVSNSVSNFFKSTFGKL